jgi:Na+(H+)/acetate symporter ActP
LAASSICPLLVLGIWWRGLTPAGAAAGLIAGGGLAGGAALAAVGGAGGTGWIGTLLGQPAAWTVPIAFSVMVVVSLATRSQVPAHVGRVMVQMHAPEGLSDRLSDLRRG